MTLRQAIDRMSGRSLDPTASFLLCDIDEAGPNYYGYVTMAGAWMIKKYDTGSMRYAFGVDDYATQWADRASISYSLPNGV